jgi:metal-responsive CopG/Arc/MetJ family transcriptional regulator
MRENCKMEIVVIQGRDDRIKKILWAIRGKYSYVKQKKQQARSGASFWKLWKMNH